MRLFKKEVLFSAIMLIVGLAMVSNQAVAQENMQSNLSGTVVDSTGQAVSDVEVSIQGMDKSSTTDDQGRFTFDNLQPGTYTITVDAAGYKPWSKEVEVTNEGKELEIRLKSMEEGM